WVSTARGPRARQDESMNCDYSSDRPGGRGEGCCVERGLGRKNYRARPRRQHVKKSLMFGPALAAVIALTIAGCAEPPGAGTAETAAPPSDGTASSPAAGAADFKACMVSDAGGFDDESFNQTSYKGLTDAKTELGI